MRDHDEDNDGRFPDDSPVEIRREGFAPEVDQGRPPSQPPPRIGENDPRWGRKSFPLT